jgi:hypothetical protein
VASARDIVVCLCSCSDCLFVLAAPWVLPSIFIPQGCNSNVQYCSWSKCATITFNTVVHHVLMPSYRFVMHAGTCHFLNRHLSDSCSVLSPTIVTPIVTHLPPHLHVRGSIVPL